MELRITNPLVVGEVTNSQKRCPTCSKRMLVQGPEFDLETGKYSQLHGCWNCGYQEREAL